MKIYTRTGDAGETSLGGGGAQRARKDSVRVEAYGAVDEANASIGAARAFLPDGEISRMLEVVQNHLFSVGADLSNMNPDKTPRVREDLVEQLEGWIDEISADLFPLKNFVLPTGSAAASMLHLARTVIRRAERRVTALVTEEDGLVAIDLKYLNRLSDLLFVLSRKVNQEEGIGDIIAKF